MKRRKNLERAIVLGLLLSTSVYGNAWAETLTDDIIDATNDVLVNNDNETTAAIVINEDVDSITVSTKDNEYNITLESTGTGIRIMEDETGSVTLSGNTNIINFGSATSEGHGIAADGNGAVSLTASVNNEIYTNEGAYGDGINLDTNSNASVILNAGNSNKIVVLGNQSDGIYTENQSDKNVELNADKGNNTITATNNGIDHRGNGDVILTANNGINEITATNGDGIRVDGNGDVVLTAKENTITAGDNGIQVAGGGTVSVTANSGSNTITAVNKGITANGENSKVFLTSNNNIITINNGKADGYDYNYISAIDARENSSIEINNYADNVNGALDINLNNVYGDVRGIYVEDSSIKIGQNAFELTINRIQDIESSSMATSKYVYGIATDIGSTEETNSNITINTINDISLDLQSKNDTTRAHGIYSAGGSINLNSKEGIAKVNVNAAGSSSGSSYTHGIFSENYGYVSVDANKGIDIDVENVSEANNVSVYGVRVNISNSISPTKVHNAGTIDLITEGDIDISAIAGKGSTAYAVSANSNKNTTYGGNITLDANNVYLAAQGKSTQTLSASTTAHNKIVADNIVEITADTRKDATDGYARAIYAMNAVNEITGKNIIVKSTANGANDRAYTIQTSATNQLTQNKLESESISLTAKAGEVESTGVYSESMSGYVAETELKATTGNNSILADTYGVNALVMTGTGDAKVNMTALQGSNVIEAGALDNNGFGDSYAINALSSTVILDADKSNQLSGAIYASRYNVNSAKSATVKLDSANNIVKSYAVINGAGDIDTVSENDSNGNKNKFKDKKFVSSLYAEDGAHIELTGENYIGTWADNTKDEYLERTVWAYSQEDDVASTIKITGAAQIGTDRYEISPNSADVAIAAGTATKLDKEKVDSFEGKRSTVTVEYDNFADGGFSSISGDILSAYAGNVDIYSNNADAKLYVKGNLLAGNNGILNIDLGNGGYFEGRTDDYQDAGTAADKSTVANADHLNFYDPAFSSTIFSSGAINLDMGTGSRWNVTGQSWVTSLSGEGIIDMRNDNEDLNSGTTNNANEVVTDNNSHAVHIGTLTGKNTFVMDLNDNSHNISDMLYIKDKENSRGEQKVFLNSVEGLENMQDGDKLRFATVNAGTEQLSFVGEYKGENGYVGSKSRAMLNDTGFNNVAFEIKNETYSTADAENTGYNGEDFDTTKPGNEYVDSEYGNDATNWYITRNSSGDGMSDAGKTMLNMSRANYSNAIYMDRLNKRLGEARYINGEEDEGMWVRIRHDRIGKTDAYRSQNTMYELGYDKKQDCDNGERRVGFAVDYMHGDTGYSDIAGKGEIDRYGLWLYDTWMGNKGHYVDYVAKWGHLSNEFEIYNSRGQVTGDYSNNVFSISAEYGRKKDMGNDWYIEPQAQLQLARVTGADYVTSQGTKVSVDGINSLIGRAGFRLGKDFGEEKQSTVYIKADVLHEFLGDQDISAFDATTNGSWDTISYENEGTWYDVGFGFATMMSKNSYAFLDLEKSFGHDNDETYQINAGVQWTF